MKESLSSENLALEILTEIESAIIKIKDRTSYIQCADDFLLTPAGMEKLDAVCMQLIAIGESLKNLDKVTNQTLLPTYPQIPWKKVKGLRDIIVHHYFDVDAEQIWWIIDNELDPLLKAITFFIKKYY